MKPGQLLDSFNRIAEAPEAIPRLRRFILDLAVRGKLVPQDPKDEPAAELLKMIEREKAQLLEIAGVNRRQAMSEHQCAIKPFSLPLSWIWMEFGDLILRSDSGISPKTEGFARSESEWGILKVSAVSWGRFDPGENKQMLRGSPPPESTHVHDGDFLISRANTSELVAKCVIVDAEPKNLALSDKIVRLSLTRYCSKKFLKLVNNDALYARSYYAREASGASPSMKNVSRDVIFRLPVPLPPLAEQHRIVAKVDELMGVCDRWEAAQAERERRRDRLVVGTHAALCMPETEAGNATFALRQFSNLTTRPEHIAQLRQTILHLAVRGKLVPQDPNDEPASQTLKQVETIGPSPAKLNASRRIPLLPINPELAPFPLPSGWCWARFPELGVFGRGRSKHRPRNDPALFLDGEYPLIQTGDVARSNGRIETHTSRYNEAGLAQSTIWPAGTICITIAANIADSGVLTFDACFPDSIVGFLADPVFGGGEYFEFFLRTAKADLLAFASATAQKNINLEILTTVLIPLPPLAEQHRIVAKVNELMALCDHLEAQLTRTQAESSRLLESVLHEAVEAAA